MEQRLTTIQALSLPSDQLIDFNLSKQHINSGNLGSLTYSASISKMSLDSPTVKFDDSVIKQLKGIQPPLLKLHTINQSNNKLQRNFKRLIHKSTHRVTKSSTNNFNQNSSMKSQNPQQSNRHISFRCKSISNRKRYPKGQSNIITLEQQASTASTFSSVLSKASPQKTIKIKMSIKKQCHTPLLKGISIKAKQLMFMEDQLIKLGERLSKF